MADRTCGGCTMCCKVQLIEADDGSVFSPAMSWCHHCEIGKGCRVYTDPAAKPAVCDTFKCLYLFWPDLHEDLRPDRSRCVAMTRVEPLFLGKGNAANLQPGLRRFLIFDVYEAAPGAFLHTKRGLRLFELLQRSTAAPHQQEDLPPDVVVRSPLPIRLVRADRGAQILMRPGTPWEELQQWDPVISSKVKDVFAARPVAGETKVGVRR